MGMWFVVGLTTQSSATGEAVRCSARVERSRCAGGFARVNDSLVPEHLLRVYETCHVTTEGVHRSPRASPTRRAHGPVRYRLDRPSRAVPSALSRYPRASGDWVVATPSQPRAQALGFLHQRRPQPFPMSRHFFYPQISQMAQMETGGACGQGRWRHVGHAAAPTTCPASGASIPRGDLPRSPPVPGVPASEQATRRPCATPP